MWREVLGRLREDLRSDPDTRWAELIRLLPTQPNDPSLHGLDLPLYLERFFYASKLVHEEGAALEWFRSLRQQYRDALQKASSGESPAMNQERLRAVESLIEGYVKRLEGPEVLAMA